MALSAAPRIIRSDEGQQRRDIWPPASVSSVRMGEVSLGLTDSVSAIQPLIVGDNARALNWPAVYARRGLLGNGDPSTDGAGRQRAFAPDPDSRPSCWKTLTVYWRCCMATVNKQAVAAAFGRAASGYTQHDELQRRCADLLLRQLARRDFALDAGWVAPAV